MSCVETILGLGKRCESSQFTSWGNREDVQRARTNRKEKGECCWWWCLFVSWCGGGERIRDSNVKQTDGVRTRNSKNSFPRWRWPFSLQLLSRIQYFLHQSHLFYKEKLTVEENMWNSQWGNGQSVSWLCIQNYMRTQKPGTHIRDSTVDRQTSNRSKKIGM